MQGKFVEKITATIHHSETDVAWRLSGRSADWIRIAEQLGMGWWITSALESNLGLNAVSQFAANYKLPIPQGLGTGAIYANNIPSPLRVSGGKLTYDAAADWDMRSLE